MLSGFKKVKIATEYFINSKPIEDLPVSASELEQVEVKFEELDGWEEDITGVKSYDDLPLNVKNFLERLTTLLEIPVCGFSVGPERNQTIITDRSLVKACGMNL